jgi:predicted nucleic acid-binding protein
MDLVLDASVALAWWLPETETNRRYALAVARARLEGAVFHAPFIFETEIASGLLRAMRSRRIDLDLLHAALLDIESVGVQILHYPVAARSVIELATRYHLQAADAHYFEFARSRGYTLAALDGGLRTAARSHGVKFFAP